MCTRPVPVELRGSPARDKFDKMRISLLGIAALLGSTLPAHAGPENLSLSPVPYALTLPQDIISHLSAGEAAGPFAAEVKQAGATASTLVYYQPAQGARTILMSVYYFPAARYDAAHKPDEPPRFGQEVIRKDGMVAPVTALDVLVGRPTEAKEDQHPVFVDRNGVWEADVALRRGKWMMMVEAKAADGTLFRQRLDLV